MSGWTDEKLKIKVPQFLFLLFLKWTWINTLFELYTVKSVLYDNSFRIILWTFSRVNKEERKDKKKKLHSEKYPFANVD